MERRERPTIMDGTVVTFAESFSGRDSGIDLPTPEGPYRVSASRNAVVVHKADLRSMEDVEACVMAIRAAAAEAEDLSKRGWGGNFKVRESLGKGRESS